MYKVFKVVGLFASQQRGSEKQIVSSEILQSQPVFEESNVPSSFHQNMLQKNTKFTCRKKKNQIYDNSLQNNEITRPDQK